jgi:hypothetical protein
MRVEQKLLCVRKVVFRLGIFNQCGLQNNTDQKTRRLKAHQKNALRMLMQRQGSSALVSREQISHIERGHQKTVEGADKIL